MRRGVRGLVGSFAVMEKQPCTMLALVHRWVRHRRHAVPTPTRADIKQKKTTFRRRSFQLGYLDSNAKHRADSIQKGADRRSSNKSLSYRLNQRAMRIREHDTKTYAKRGEGVGGQLCCDGEATLHNACIGA